MSAARLLHEGQTTLSGAPVTLPGEREARKLALSQAVGKALGFQPLSSCKDFDLCQSMEQINGFRDELQQKWANRAHQAIKAGNARELVAIQEEVRQWNREALHRQKLLA